MKLDTLLSQANEKHQVTTRSGAEQMGGATQNNAEQSGTKHTSDSIAPRSGLGHDLEEEGGGYGDPPQQSSKERGRHHDRNVTMNSMVFKMIGS